MAKCPHCGESIDSGAIAAPVNSERQITITVPERHFALFRKTFADMNMKLGMYGLGELANALSPYAEPFRENRDMLRYFDDGALAMSLIGVVNGYPAAARIGATKGDRVEVFVDFTLRNGEVKPMRVAEHATLEAAHAFVNHFQDQVQRLSPLDQPNMKINDRDG